MTNRSLPFIGQAGNSRHLPRTVVAAPASLELSIYGRDARGVPVAGPVRRRIVVYASLTGRGSRRLSSENQRRQCQGGQRGQPPNVSLHLTSPLEML